ncbi:MAG: DUF6391 domain-containing protein [Candidatus Promineifilaceae bacterium]
MIKQFISRVRRNHGLEHASIHVLSEKHEGFSAQGNSNHRGFYLNIYGEIPEADITAAVEEAFTRMKGGEHGLAVHPNCGTVLLTTATMTTLAAQAAFAVEQFRQSDDKSDVEIILGGLPMAVLASAVALILSRPAGISLQKNYTVEGDLQEMQLVRVKKIQPNITTRLFKLLLAGGQPLNSTSYFVETVH